VLASRQSNWLIDYLIAVVAFNRGIRRMVDYYNGEFDPYSPISLTPLVVAGLAALIVIQRIQSGDRTLGPVTRTTLRWYLTACGLALVVGLYRNRLGAVYELGNYLGPVGMIGFGALYGKSPQIMRRWGTSAVAIGIGVAVYGLFQFYTIPPWDAFWVRAVEFEGYLGTLEPTKMTLFSTLNDRGPAAMFLAGTLILIALRPALLGPLRAPAAVLVAIAMLYTYSRTTVIHVVLAVVALPIVTKGRGLGVLAIATVLLAFFGESLLGFLPNNSFVADRYATLGNIQDDGSFKGRIILLQLAIGQAIRNPLGLGLGSQGLAGRVTNTQAAGIMDSTGYLQILTTFGFIGAGLIVAVLRQLWISSRFVHRQQPRDPDTNLFQAWFVSGMVVLFSGNWLASVSYFWLLAGYVVGQEDYLRAMQRSIIRSPAPLAHRPEMRVR